MAGCGDIITGPLVPPILRDDKPIYPVHLQLVRIGVETVPGPLGYRSASATADSGTTLYIGSTQQLRTDTLTPRDREPCLVTNPNGFPLGPGYYLARLSGSHQSLPVYTTYCCLPPGLTAEQINKALVNLTATQISNLSHLTPQQWQTFIQLPPTDMQRLTTNLTPPQLNRVIDDLTFTKLQQLVTTTSTPQTLVISSAYPPTYQLIMESLPPTQAIALLTSLTSQQIGTLIDLTAQQLQTISQLTISNLQKLTSLTSTQVPTLVDELTFTQLTSLLTTLTTAQLVQLTNTLTSTQIQQIALILTPEQIQNVIPTLVPAQPIPAIGKQELLPQLPIAIGQPSSTPTAFPGYAPIAYDNNGKLWGYTGGVWQDLSSGGGTFTWNYRTATGPDTVNAAIGDFIVGTTSGGSITVNLPAASGNAGKMVAAKNVTPGASSVIFDGSGGETIRDGGGSSATTLSITGAGQIILVCTGGTTPAWDVLSTS